MHEPDYFALLGVQPNATNYDIRRAYLDLRRIFEPNRLLTAATADLHDDVVLIVDVIEEAYQVCASAGAGQSSTASTGGTGSGCVGCYHWFTQATGSATFRGASFAGLGFARQAVTSASLRAR